MYTPWAVMLPPVVPSWTDQFTAVLVVFETVAVNVWGVGIVTVELPGDTEILTLGGGG